MSILDTIKPNEVTADVFQYKQLIAGRPKSGKTSLFYELLKIKYDGDLSKGLLIAFERGYQALGGIYAKDIQEWEEFQDLVEELVDNKDEVSFEVLALDTIDVLIERATEYVINKASIADKKRYMALGDISWGKGYAMLADEIADQVDKLDHAGYSLFFITHDKDRTMTTRDGLEYNKTTISASGRGGEYFKNSADIITFIELTKELEGGNKVDKRYIYFRGDADMEAGSRFKHMPVRVEYSAENYIEAVENAILKEYGGDEEKVEKAQEEQAEERAEKEAEQAEITPESLIAKVDDILADKTNEQKVQLAEVLKQEFTSPNYKKMTDTKDLEKVVALANKL